MQLHDARLAVMAAMECADYSRAATLLDEYTAVYPEQGARLCAEVVEAYPEITL